MALCLGAGVYGSSLGAHVTQSGFFDEGSESAQASRLGDKVYGTGRSFDDAVQRTMRKIAATKVGVALFRPTANHLDQLVSKLTGGRRSFAGIVSGLPAVILTTTGAKSGEPRTVAVYGVLHPDGLALIASN